MQSLNDVPVGLGDDVVDDHSGENGVVVQRLDDHYVRVLWDNRKTATTHRGSSLNRAVDAARLWH